MDENVLPSKLLSHLSSAVDVLNKHTHVHVFTHHDADGVSAGGILATMLQRMDKQFQVSIVPILNEETFELVKNSTFDCILMSDLGASYIDKLEELDKDIIVLDHHRTERDSEKIVYANPHLYGIDGMTSGCGATMSLLLAVHADENNWDLVQFAFAGIAGDRQHIKGLSGLNEYLITKGVEKEFIQIVEGSLIPSGPLVRSLYLSTDPYIRGVSGNHEGVMAIMEDAGIANNKSFMDLTEDEKWKLSSLISIKLTKQRVTSSTMQEVSRKRYFLRDYNMDAETMSDLLNACGRNELGAIGIGICLGDKDCLLKAMELNDEYKNKCVTSITELDSVGLTEMENIQYFDSTSMGLTGILCGIAMQFIGNPNKPTIGINNPGEGMGKASSRGMWCQLDAGVDLSAAMHEAAEIAGGEGGGHKIASGASFTSENEELFLNSVNEIVGKQKLNHAK